MLWLGVAAIALNSSCSSVMSAYQESGCCTQPGNSVSHDKLALAPSITALSFANYAAGFPGQLDVGANYLVNALAQQQLYLAQDNALQTYSLSSAADVIYAPTFYFSGGNAIPELYMLTNHAAIGLTPQQFKSFCATAEGDALLQEVFHAYGYHGILAGDAGEGKYLYAKAAIDASQDAATVFGSSKIDGVPMLRYWLQGLGATRDSSDPDFVERTHPGIDNDQPWFSTMTKRYEWLTEPHNAYFLLIKMTVWTPLSAEQKAAVETACAQAWTLQFEQQANLLAAWEAANPTTLVAEAMPSGIVSEYDAYITQHQTDQLAALANDHVAVRLRNALMEF